MSRDFPVPSYLPACVHPVLPWARAHVTRTAHRYGLGTTDLWDETLAALLRVAVARADNGHQIGPDDHYSQRAIRRACYRYVVRGSRPTVPLPDRLATASPEDELLAREVAARRLVRPRP